MIKTGVNKKRKTMDNKLLQLIYVVILVIELISIIAMVILRSVHYTMLNELQMLYYICYFVLEISLMYIYDGKLSMIRPPYNYNIIICYIFLIISYTSNVINYNKFSGLPQYILDFSLLISRYIFLLSHSPKFQSINYKTTRPYKIHDFLFGAFSIITIIINNSYSSSKSLFAINGIVLLLAKHIIDLIILYKIWMQLSAYNASKTPIIQIVNKDEAEQLLPSANPESVVVSILDNKTTETSNDFESKSNDKIRQRFGNKSNESSNRINKTMVIQSNLNADNNETKSPKSNRSSAAKSIKVIDEYKGNEAIQRQRAIYKKQHKLKQMQKFTKKIPPKPTNIDEYIDDDIKMLYQQLMECFNKNTHYIGIYGNHGGIDIEFIASKDSKITGQRIIDFKKSRVEGNGRIFYDLLWNDLEDKYVICVCFEYVDEYNGIQTKFQFNSLLNEMDCNHLYFQGECIENEQRISYFEMVCVSIRRRDINQRGTLLEYHNIKYSQDQPNYIRCINISTRRLNLLYNAK